MRVWCSDDLFSDQRKCTVFAGDLPELEEALSQSLQVGVGVYVLVRFPAQLVRSRTLATSGNDQAGLFAHLYTQAPSDMTYI